MQPEQFREVIKSFIVRLTAAVSLTAAAGAGASATGAAGTGAADGIAAVGVQLHSFFADVELAGTACFHLHCSAQQQVACIFFVLASIFEVRSTNKPPF